MSQPFLILLSNQTDAFENLVTAAASDRRSPILKHTFRVSCCNLSWFCSETIQSAIGDVSS